MHVSKEDFVKHEHPVDNSIDPHTEFMLTIPPDALMVIIGRPSLIEELTYTVAPTEHLEGIYIR